MKIILQIILLFLCLPAHSQLIHDESYLDESFWHFKTKLEYAVMKKDTGLLSDLLAEKVYESPDGCGYPGCPKDEFLRLYFDRSSGLSEMTWTEMSSILRYGFEKIPADSSGFEIQDSIVFRAPSYLGKIDNDAELIVLGQNVNIRDKPGIKSKIIRTSSFEIFDCFCSTATQTEQSYQQVEGIGWVEVRMGNKALGYIASKYTSYDIYREILIGKENGKWKLFSFAKTRYC